MADEEHFSLEQELQSVISKLSPQDTLGGEPPAGPAETTPEPAPQPQPEKPPPAPAPAAEAQPPPEVPQTEDDTPEVLRGRIAALEAEKARAEKQSAEASRQLLDQLKAKYGLDLTGKYTDDEKALEGLANAYSTVGRRDDDAQRWRAFSQNPAEYLRQWGVIPSQEQAAPNSAVPVDGAAESAPPYDPAWYGQVERDPETGEVVGVKPGSDPTILQKIRTAEDYYRRKQLELAFQPEKAMAPILERYGEKIRRDIIDQVAQVVGSQQAESEIRNRSVSWMMSPENAKWLFNKDEGGHPNPKMGLTDAGHQFQRYCEEATEKMGISKYDMDRVVAYATDRMELDWRRRKMVGPQGSNPPGPAMTRDNVAASGANTTEAKWIEGESLENALRRAVGLMEP